MPYKCKRYKDTEIHRERETKILYFFTRMATQSRGQTGHSRVRVSYDMPGNRADSSSSFPSPCPLYLFPMQQLLYLLVMTVAVTLPVS